MGFKKTVKLFLYIIIIILAIGLALPSRLIIPVKNASTRNWNKESFWYYPWGNSGTHKGIDIFSAKGMDVVAPTAGFILSSKSTGSGGKVIKLLGAKWRVYYFAHLDTFFVKPGNFVWKGETIGRVGNTGNAINKEPHLHFSIFSVLPYFWLYEKGVPQGFLKMFYLNPNNYLE